MLVEETQETVKTRPWLASSILQDMNKHEIGKEISKGYAKILNSFDNFVRMGSGWFLLRIIQLELWIHRFRPFSRRSCSHGNNKLPSPFNKMRSILTLRQIPLAYNKCLLYCVLAGLFPSKRRKSDFNQYTKYENRIDSSSLKYPVKICEILDFEKTNNILLNIYTLKKKKTGDYFASCLRISENENRKNISIYYCISVTIILSKTFPLFFGPKPEIEDFSAQCLHFCTTLKILKRHKCGIIRA